MAFLQNIIFVTQLKNKGVRRICFIVGILLTIIPTCIWYEGLSKNFYNETYENIIEFAEKNKYDTEKQKAVFNKYPANTLFSQVKTFEDWRDIFISNNYIGEQNVLQRYYLEQCNILEKGKIQTLAEIFQDDEGYKKLQKFCPKLKQYMSQKISISKANYLYLLKLIWSLFWFYIPFLLSCIVKWIYMGFKEK